MIQIGDKETNRYTDAVINDMKRRIKTDFEVAYYGGSTYIPHRATASLKNRTMPFVCIETNASFTFDCTQYLLKDTNSVVKSYHHDFVNTLPYEYGITAYIYYNEDTEEKAKIIEKKLRSEYASEVQIWIDIPDRSGRKSAVKLCVDTTNNVKSLFGTFFKSIAIKFTPNYSVYFWQGYKRENIADNPKQQFALLQATEFALLTHRKITNDAIRWFESIYHAAFITHETVMMYMFDKSYKEVVKRSKRGKPIDRTLFETAFKDIVQVYPHLYDYYIQGKSYEEIDRDLKRRAEILDQRYAQLCKDLQLPDKINGNYGVIFNREWSKDLQLLIKKMDNTDTPLDKAIQKCLEELEKERLEEIQEEEEWAEIEALFRPNNTSSSSGGILKTAAGVALGNKLSGVGSSNKKRDFMGSAGCMYGKKKDGWIVHCDMSCPLYIECSRGRGF